MNISFIESPYPLVTSTANNSTGPKPTLQAIQEAMAKMEKHVHCIGIIAQAKTYKIIEARVNEMASFMPKTNPNLPGYSALYERVYGIALDYCLELPESILYILRYSDRTMDIHYADGTIKKVPDYDDPNVHDNPQNSVPLWQYLHRKGLLHRDGGPEVPGEVWCGPGGEGVSEALPGQEPLPE